MLNDNIVRKRRVWLAGLLSLAGGPVGHVYVGHLKRAVVILVTGWLLALVAFPITLSLPFGRVAVAILFLLAIGYPLWITVDAVRLALRKGEATLLPYQRWWAYVLFAVTFIALNHTFVFPLRSLCAEAFVNPSRGMANTILPGDHFIVDKVRYRFQPIRHGDVVAFYSEGKGSPLYVMRVVGLPGDCVEIRDEVVIRNGKRLWEDYAKFQGSRPPHVDLGNYGPEVVPEHHVFVLGDNRRLSKDSRIIGFIPKTDVVGQARIIYWSTVRSSPEWNGGEDPAEGSVRWARLGLLVR